MRKWLLLGMVLLSPLAAPAKHKTRVDPMPVYLTDRKGQGRATTLLGQNAFEIKEADPMLHFGTGSGVLEFSVDTLVSITDIREPKGQPASALITFKDGTQRRLEFGFTQECFWFRNPDSTVEKVDLRKMTSLEVLGRPPVH
jgi:hypothetical protein